MQLRLEREPETEHSTPGTLAVDGEAFCFTLEPTSTDPKYPRIPAGTYGFNLYQSPGFGTTVLMLHNVPGRSAIEVHHGNFPRDTKGCVIVGADRAEDAVLNSRVTLKALVERVRAAEGPHTIEVVDP